MLVSTVIVPPSGRASRALSDQVQHDLLDLRLVDPDRAQFRIETQLKHDVFPNQAGQQILHRRGNLVEAQQTRGRGLGTGKNQQLPHQSGGLHDGRADLIGVAAPAVARIQTGEQQITIQHDAGQQIVEVMHHSARQTADRFPALRLKRAFLHRNCLVGALRDEQRMVGFPRPPRLAPCRSTARSLVPGSAPKAAMAMRSRLRASRSFSSDSVLSPVLRTNQFAEPQRAPAGYLIVQAPPEGRVHLDNHSLRVAAGNRDGSVFEDGTEYRAAVPFCGKTGPRKWGCRIHTANVARDESRKKAHGGLSDTLVFPKWEQRCQCASFLSASRPL